VGALCSERGLDVECRENVSPLTWIYPKLGALLVLCQRGAVYRLHPVFGSVP